LQEGPLPGAEVRPPQFLRALRAVTGLPALDADFPSEVALAPLAMPGRVRVPFRLRVGLRHERLRAGVDLSQGFLAGLARGAALGGQARPQVQVVRPPPRGLEPRLDLLFRLPHASILARRRAGDNPARDPRAPPGGSGPILEDRAGKGSQP